MRATTLFCSLCALLAVAAHTPLAAEETLILLARHAEKEATTGNPDLTARGRERAEALADIGQSWNVRAVYTTDFCRTAQTALPLAGRQGLPLFVQPTGSSAAGVDGCTPPIDAPAIFLGTEVRSPEGLLRWILERHRGEAVLVVGHSNTVPALLAELGVGDFAIAEDQYDRLFLVTYDFERGPRVVERSYGENEEPEQGPEPAARSPIVDRAIAFHGGERYEASRTRLTIASRSGSFRLDVRREGGLFDYAVEDVRDETTRRTRATNELTERTLGGEPVPLEGDDAVGRARNFVFARVYFPFLPFGLNDPGVFKTDQGLETWDGRRLHRVKVTFTPGSSASAADDYAFWFDPESGRLEQYAYSFGTGGPTGGLRFRPLSNYRRVGGILFFDAENLGVDGDGDFTVDSIDPDYVAEEMEPVSTVVLSDIEVEPLD